MYYLYGLKRWLHAEPVDVRARVRAGGAVLQRDDAHPTVRTEAGLHDLQVRLRQRRAGSQRDSRYRQQRVQTGVCSNNTPSFSSTSTFVVLLAIFLRICSLLSDFGDDESKSRIRQDAVRFGGMLTSFG